MDGCLRQAQQMLGCLRLCQAWQGAYAKHGGWQVASYSKHGGWQVAHAKHDGRVPSTPSSWQGAYAKHMDGCLLRQARRMLGCLSQAWQGAYTKHGGVPTMPSMADVGMPMPRSMVGCLHQAWRGAYHAKKHSRDHHSVTQSLFSAPLIAPPLTILQNRSSIAFYSFGDSNATSSAMKHEKVQELTRGSSGTQTSFFSAPLIAHTPIDSSKITWLLVVIKWFHKVADWIVFNCVAFNEPVGLVGCFGCSIMHCRTHTTAPNIWNSLPK